MFAFLLSKQNMCLILLMAIRFLLSLSTFYLVLATSASSSSSSVQGPLCHDSESSALLQFKQSFGVYASYYPSACPKLATWKAHADGEGSDCCSWGGVECDRKTGHVIGLHLASSCLYGSINSSSTLFNLLHLRRLDLSYNNFNYSQIPSAVAQLSKLRSLNLSHSVFSGQIPSQLLALSKLVFLDLYGYTDNSGNPLLKLQKPGLRDVVQSLTHLKKLYLNLVDISSVVPHELVNFSSLTGLGLAGCRLHGEFPHDIFRLPRLQALYLGYNPNLTGHLPEFQEGSPLRILYLPFTSFSGELPTSIGRLSSLTELDIHSCNFTGKIPHSLANLTALTQFILSNNKYFSVGTLSWLGPQTKLTVLDLDHINLGGEIPSSLVNMSQLTVLSLQGNQLSGQIPSSLMNLTRLTALLLESNNFEGPIPCSLFELTNLEYLDLHTNRLNGTLELHLLSKLKNLIQLQLSYNRLSLLTHNTTNVTFPELKLLGLNYCNLTQFPDFLRNQHELEFLSLSGNNIHGRIPTWMWNISKGTLDALFLSGNFLTGFDQNPVMLPWSRLSYLELDSNRLQGPLPIPPPSIFHYKVSGNELTGPVPPLICYMTYLMVLDLSGNNLSGVIPPCLAGVSRYLAVLDLGSNNFNGPIPETCTAQNNLKVIDIGGNQLEGPIPKSLGNCMMLEHLVLGDNQIDDVFPFWLGALPELQVLILGSNRLHGQIQSNTGFKFPMIRIIDLSDNDFMGDLPSEFFPNLDAMKLANASNGLWYLRENSPFTVPGYEIDYPYVYSMTITNKGMQRFYPGIPDTFMAIDFSGNNFRGQIPACIGRLQGLHMLNLGRNNLTGPIPSSLGNLTQLESLDLSQNMLSGRIPWQLTSLTFLGFFNVSHNNLTGPIPEGQLTKRSNDSFDGNPGLCGPPLSRACEGPPPPLAPNNSSEGSTNELDWKIVLMGYGSGVVIGVSIGYCFTAWKHEWFLKTFGGKPRRNSKWVRTERMGLRS